VLRQDLARLGKVLGPWWNVLGRTAVAVTWMVLGAEALPPVITRFVRESFPSYWACYGSCSPGGIAVHKKILRQIGAALDQIEGSKKYRESEKRLRKELRRLRS
jgi:hypothetical protein